jgi:type VI secretion system secreted protein VgrG
MRVSTELEEDVLLLQSFDGRERLSAPFEWELRLLSEDPSIGAEDLLRTPMVVQLETPSGEERLVHGLVRRFVQLGQQEEVTAYRAEIVPWTWFLSLTRDCQVFQDKDVLEIVEDVFDTQGYSNYEIRCTRNYPRRDYCVQYRETHLNFVSRLLEEEGIFYFFEHTEDKHTLVITDDNSKMEPCPGQETARIRQENVPEEDVVTGLIREHSVNAGEVSLADYDYLQPSLSLKSSISGEGDGEIRDYHPRRFTSREDGDRRARLLMELEESRRQLIRGESTCRAFRSGHRFELEGHYRRDVNREYVLVEIRHSGSAGDVRSGEGGSLDYRNEFLAIPHDVPYRPPRNAEKPVVRGSQTAIVVGKSGEEIWTDGHGRIKVQFHWDREGEHDENSSCWVRVASRWAGKSWGEVHTPRMGQEVVVDFLEGDPDRPLVTGSVYNADYPPPYDLGGSGKTKSGMKSRSSKGGGGYNEISIDDKKGEEKVTVHAQKDRSARVENDDSISVGNDRTISVEGKRAETVKKDTSLQVKEGNLNTKISEGKSDEYVKKNRSVKVDGECTFEVKKKTGITVKEGDLITTTKQGSITSNGKKGNTVKSDQTVKLKGNEVKANADASVTVDGQKVSISGKTEVKLSVGGNYVKIDQTGVTIFGAMVKIN